MTSAVLALALAATPAGGDVVDLFIDACVNGELRVSKEQAREISWSDLPHGPRAHVHELREIGSKGRIIEVDAPGPAYLATRKYDGRTRDGVLEKCYLVTNAIEYPVAVRRISEALNGPSASVPMSANQMSYQWDVPQQRYRVRVWKVLDGYTAMRTTIVDEAAAAKGLAEQQKQIQKYQERLEGRRSQEGEN
jgi:hypothetical protein